MDKAPVSALKLCQTRASLVSNVDSRANETYTGQGGRYEMPAPDSSLRRDSAGLSVGAGSRAPAGPRSELDAAPTKWVTLLDWKVIPLPAGQPGERVCSPSELRQLLGQQVHQFYARDSGYKEPIATSPLASENSCSKWAVIGQCAEGHTVAKEILCGREWCPVCGEEWSKAHQRRFARWLPKAQQIAKMGYFVIEWPDASRSKLKTKRELSDMGKLVKSYFVELGYKRGLRRWHWFGDYAGLIGGRKVNLEELRIPYLEAFDSFIETFAKMNGTHLVLNPNQRTIFWRNPGGESASVIARLVADFAKTYGLHVKAYSTIKLNPHLNILVDGCHISKERLELIKASLRQLLNEPSLIVNYHYRTSVKAMVHALKYVTRATFLSRSWDDEFADELYNFQNSNYWGVWHDEIAWSLDESNPETSGVDFEHVKAIQAGLCPVCGKLLKWSRPNSSRVRTLALAKFGIDGDMLREFGRGLLGDETRERIAEAMHRSSIAERISFVRSLRLHTTTEANLLSMDMVRQCGAREIGGGYWIFPVVASPTFGVMSTMPESSKTEPLRFDSEPSGNVPHTLLSLAHVQVEIGEFGVYGCI